MRVTNRCSSWVVAVAAAFAACAAGPRHLPAPGAKGPYSGSVAADGLVFLAGKVASDRSSFAAEVHSAIDGVVELLAARGLGLGDVVSVNVYLTDITTFAAMNEIYAARFPQPYPARTTVGVAALPGGARIEIQVVAARR